MFMICPVHTAEFLKKHNLGVEAHIGRYDKRPGWDTYIPFVHAVHLPYSGLNLASFKDEERKTAIETVKAAIDIGCQYPVDKMVMHTMGYETMGENIVGNYDRMIDGIQKIADYAAEKKITICVENQVLHPATARTYGSFAHEWFMIQRDTNRSNVMLTLDTSHAATSAAAFATPEDRIAYLYEYLKHPELIGRVHWSDSLVSNGEAYFKDWHLVPGKGDIPREFHQKIKALDAVKTLEQKAPEEEVEEALRFIESL